MELETQIKASQNAIINVPNLERFIEDMQSKLPDLDFEGKRLALDMLGITIYLDGENVEITGTIDPYCAGALLHRLLPLGRKTVFTPCHCKPRS